MWPDHFHIPPIIIGQSNFLKKQYEYYQCMLEYIKEHPGMDRKQIFNLMYDFDLETEEKENILRNIDENPNIEILNELYFLIEN